MNVIVVEVVRVVTEELVRCLDWVVCAVVGLIGCRCWLTRVGCRCSGRCGSGSLGSSEWFVWIALGGCCELLRRRGLEMGMGPLGERWVWWRDCWMMDDVQ